MRTALLIASFLIHDAITHHSGKEHLYSESTQTFMMWVLITFIVMDIVDFFNKIIHE